MSTLRLTTISNQDGSATVPSQTVISGSAKAWVNFNGTGTVAIRASYNVTSITDGGTGIYTVNFTTAMTDANYSSNASLGSTTTANYACVFEYNGTTRTTTTLPILIASGTWGAIVDCPIINVSVFR
jgi:hypothetical protein